MKPVIAALTDVAEAFRSEYELKEDGKYHIKLDATPPGYVAASVHKETVDKLKEFRDTNTGLMTTKAELEAQVRKFEGIDPEAAKAALEKLTKLEKKGVKGDDDLEALVARATAAAVAPINAKLEAAEKASAASARALREKEFEATLTKVVSGKVLDTALADVLGRAKAVYKEKEDGSFVPEVGGKTLYGESGLPLTPEEWTAKLAVEAPHLFKSSGGGGSNGPGSGGGAKKTISSDPLEFGRNLEDIAAGKVTVAEA
jgi:hypothetical protein